LQGWSSAWEVDVLRTTGHGSGPPPHGLSRQRHRAMGRQAGVSAWRWSAASLMRICASCILIPLSEVVVGAGGVLPRLCLFFDRGSIWLDYVLLVTFLLWLQDENLVIFVLYVMHVECSTSLHLWADSYVCCECNLGAFVSFYHCDVWFKTMHFYCSIILLWSKWSKIVKFMVEFQLFYSLTSLTRSICWLVLFSKISMGFLGSLGSLVVWEEKTI
jgi:hypothetical protein